MKNELSDDKLKQYSHYIAKDLIEAADPKGVVNNAEAGRPAGKSVSGERKWGWQQTVLTAAVFVIALTVTGIILVVNRAGNRSSEQGDTHLTSETALPTEAPEEPDITPEPGDFEGVKYSLTVPEGPDYYAPELTAMRDSESINMSGLVYVICPGMGLRGLPEEIFLDEAGNFMLIYRTHIQAMYQPIDQNSISYMEVRLRCTGKAIESSDQEQNGAPGLTLRVDNVKYLAEDNRWDPIDEETMQALIEIIIEQDLLGQDGIPTDEERAREYINGLNDGSKYTEYVNNNIQSIDNVPVEIRLLRLQDGGFILSGIDFNNYPSRNIAYHDNWKPELVEFGSGANNSRFLLDDNGVMTRVEGSRDLSGESVKCDFRRESRSDGSFDLVVDVVSNKGKETFRYNDEGIALNLQLISGSSLGPGSSYFIKPWQADYKSFEPCELKTMYIPMLSMAEGIVGSGAASEQLEGVIDSSGHVYVKVTDPFWSKDHYAIRVVCDADAEVLLNLPELSQLEGRPFSEVFFLMNMLCQYPRTRVFTEYIYPDSDPSGDPCGVIQNVLYFTDERVVNCCISRMGGSETAVVNMAIYSIEGNEWVEKPWLEFDDSEAGAAAYLNKLKETVMKNDN